MGSRIVRLERFAPGHLAWYSIFEQRCRAFVAKYAKVEVPIDAILNERLKAWIDTPTLCGYYLFCDDQKVIGHLASWIVNYHSIYKCYIWQAEVDEPNKLLGPMIDELKTWVAAINQEAPPEMRISRFEFVTWHQASVFIRYLRGLLNVRETLSVLTADI